MRCKYLEPICRTKRSILSGNTSGTVSYLIDLIYLIDDFVWDTSVKVLSKNNQTISLTKHETMLLSLLSSCVNTVFTSQEIEVELFDDSYTDNKRVRSLISRLKNKIGVALIQSIYSEGYKLNLDNSC